ncbi:ribonuclease H-like domain-containing protein [Tanacetum coccineum]
MKAIEKRYGGNKESKKVQRTLLKQQYENFTGLSSETMDQTFDRLQKLIGQLEIQGEVISQEDMNLKLLRSLPSEWKTHTLIWRNKLEIETISLDELYNNLKIYEHEILGSSSTSQNPQNVAFVSSNSTNSKSNSSTNEADNTAYEVNAAHTQSNPTTRDNLSDVVICSFLASQPNSSQMLREDLEQIDPDDLEEMDLQWEMAMLTTRARRFIKRIGRQLDVNGKGVGFDRSKVECYNCHKYGHFARECRLLRNQEKREKENNRRTVTVETPNENALVAQDGVGGVKDTSARDRAVGNPQQKEYKEKGVIDSGCSRHITGNKCYLTEYEDYDGVFVSFGDGKGRIYGKEIGKSTRVHKVKVIRCDNGTEFKNSVMNQFYKIKGIKREFSVARTPQQNGVAERRNRTLIELIVEETLNNRFLENTPNVTGNGPNWLFDVDSLTISRNYVPVVIGKQTNGIAGTRDYIVTGQVEKKTEPEQEFILIPLCTTDPLISQGPKDSEENLE